MKYYKLTDEEQKLLEEVERGEWVPVKNQDKARREAMEIARNTLSKTKNIKRKAAEEGIPYQTLASSILHKATAQ